MSRRVASIIRKYRENERGAVAIIFGFMMIVMVAAIGSAVDVARGIRTQTRVTAALDAAALATAKALRLQQPSDADLQLIAQRYFDTNYAELGNDVAIHGEVKLTIDRAKFAVAMSVDARLPTTISRIFRIDELDVGGSTAAIYEAKNVELAMMLDVSGSMDGSKIRALRGAARDLVGIVLEEAEAGERHKIAIAPYSTSVNAGSYAREVTGVRRSHNCVTERSGRLAHTDAPPSEAPLGRRANWCPGSDIVPLTNDVETLERQINRLDADGATAGHLGIAWSWYLISPEWSDVWPADSRPEPYSNPEILKAIIVMTDGEFNTAYENSNGNSSAQSRSLCSNIKAAGVTVFTVAFQAPRNAENLLRSCATTMQHHFDAQDNDALRRAFQEIARRLTGLRLTN